MSIPSPEWVSFDADEPQGLDLLGLRAPVQSIGNDLMNGFTTVTPKVRYLSVLCWITQRYANPKFVNRWSEFRQFAAAHEAALVMANVIRDRGTLRLVGVDEAVARLDSTRKVLSLEPLAQQIALNIYASSSQQLGLAFESDTGVFGLFEQRGLRLAKAFDKVIGKTNYAMRSRAKGYMERVRRQDLEQLADHFSIDALPSSESAILVDALLPVRPLDAAERDRLATLATLLWLSSEFGEKTTEDALFDAAHEPPKNIPSVLRQTLNGWLIYVVRDGLAVAHEAVFDTTMREVDAAVASHGAPAPASEIVSAILNSTDDHDEQLRTLKLISKSESIRDLSFQEISIRVQNKCSRVPSFEGGIRRWSGGLSEFELSQEALVAGHAAAVLLPIIWSVAEWRVSLPSSAPQTPEQLLVIGDIFQIGLKHVVLPRLAEYRRLNLSYIEVMADLVIRTAQQHLRVSWQRFASRPGKDVSVLVADVENWSRKNPFVAGRTASRLDVAVSWLEQLGLLDNAGITDRGEQILKRSLETLGRGAS